jgi:hypothetical protein
VCCAWLARRPQPSPPPKPLRMLLQRSAAALLAVLLLCSAPPAATGKQVQISNTLPRRNSTGEIIDAHDGSYNQWGGPGTPWYYYAMAYSSCKEQAGDGCGGSARAPGQAACGYGYNGIGVWRSADLSTNGTWELLSGPGGSAGGQLAERHVLLPRARHLPAQQQHLRAVGKR